MSVVHGSQRRGEVAASAGSDGGDRPAGGSSATQALRAPVRRLFGIPVHAVTMGQVLALCEESVAARRPLMIGVVNAAKIVNMRRTPILGEAVLEADLVLADGMAVVWASRLLRTAAARAGGWNRPV